MVLFKIFAGTVLGIGGVATVVPPFREKLDRNLLRYLLKGNYL
jgi:hypothetical protein